MLIFSQCLHAWFVCCARQMKCAWSCAQKAKAGIISRYSVGGGCGLYSERGCWGFLGRKMGVVPRHKKVKVLKARLALPHMRYSI